MSKLVDRLSGVLKDRFFLVILLFCSFLIIPDVNANDGREETADWTTVMLNLKSLSIATETFALENNNNYPTKIKDLTNPDHPYLPQMLCGETVQGYNYYCLFSPTGYMFTANPIVPSENRQSITIRTDVMVEPSLMKDDSLEQKPPSAMDSLTEDPIVKYKKLIAAVPNNCQFRLVLASLLIGKGKGEAAAKEAEEIIALKPEDEILLKAYHVAIHGYYLAGKLDQSYTVVQQMLQMFPDDKKAISFEKTLQFLLEKKRNTLIKPFLFSSNQLMLNNSSATEINVPISNPQTVDSPVKEETVQQKNEIVPSTPVTEGKSSENDFHFIESPTGLTDHEVLGKIGMGPDGQDVMVLPSGKVYFTAPLGWFNSANVQNEYGSYVFRYQKNSDQTMPVILISQITPENPLESALDYLPSISNLGEEHLASFDLLPIEAMVNHYQSAFNEISFKTNDTRLSWYQFLINGRIIIIQYLNNEDQSVADYSTFQKVVNSIKVEP